jgi:hypothetical protein
MKKKIYIYGLWSPIEKKTLRNVRYIGKSNNPKRRLSEHIRTSKKKNYAVSKWIRTLIKKNLKPVMKVIEVCDLDSWQTYEKMYINYFKESGYTNRDLLNIGLGGEKDLVNHSGYNEGFRNYNFKKRKKIIRYKLNGELNKIYDYIREVENDNLLYTPILNTLKKRNIIYSQNYLWCYYADDYKTEINLPKYYKRLRFKKIFGDVYPELFKELKYNSNEEKNKRLKNILSTKRSLEKELINNIKEKLKQRKYKEYIKSRSKKIILENENNKLEFDSINDAARFIYNNNLSNGTLKTVVRKISDVLNKRRISAYSYNVAKY